MGSAREKNVAAAREAIAYCRRIIPRDGSYTHPSVIDKQKLISLRHKILNMRDDKKKHVVNDELVHRYLMHDGYEAVVKQTMKTCKKQHVGNCGELADIAANFLRKKNVKRIERVKIIGSDHTFNILDREGDDINDVNTWGPSCVVLDVLNGKVIEDPRKIYDEIEGYKFDLKQDNPHIFSDFTTSDKLEVQGEMICYIHAAENLKKSDVFHQVVVNLIKESCRVCLSEDSYDEIASQINHIISDIPASSELETKTNFDVDRLLDKKVKKILALIAEESNNQTILNEILIRTLSWIYKKIALHKAVKMQLPEIVKGLLRSPNDPCELDENNYQALHLAAKGESSEIVNFLLDHWENENIDNQDAEGQTPLHVAALNGRCSIIQELLTRNADVFVKDKYGFTALHYAAREGYADIVSLILDRDPDQINEKQNDGWTALHLAAGNNNLEVVEALLGRKADAYLLDNDGFMPLHRAVYSEDIEMVELILNSEGNANVNVKTRNKTTALHLAVKNKNLSMAEVLINRGADIYLQDQCGGHGYTALHYAALANDVAMVQLLLTHDRRCINVHSNNGSTALHVAVEQNNYSVAEILLNTGADLRLANCKGRLPIHIAAIYGYIYTLELILNADPTIIDAQNENNGSTALHVAVGNSQYDIVEELLRLGADLNIENNEGETARLLAEGDNEMIALFKNKSSTSTVSHEETRSDISTTSTTSEEEPGMRRRHSI